jgi:hypothetical protein
MNNIQTHINEHKHIIANNLYSADNTLLVTFEGQNTNTIYLNNLSATNSNFQYVTATPNTLVPLSAVYEHDSCIDLKNTTFASSGINFIYAPILQHVKDITSNKQTNFYLTTSYNLFDFLQDSRVSSSEYAFVFILSGADGFMRAQEGSEEIFVNAPIITENTTFQLEKEPTGTYKIWWNKKSFTTSREEPYDITLETSIKDDEYNQQRFQTIFSGNSAVAITTMVTNTADDMIAKYISYETDTYKLSAVDNPYYFDLINYEGLYKIDGFTSRGNDWVEYHNNITTPDLNKLSTIDSTRSLSGLKQNFLVSLPYKTKIQNNAVKFNFAGLKNIEHVGHEYTYAPIICGTSAIFGRTTENLKLREYDKVFAGTKQDRGYENLYFGYNTNFAKTIHFDPDETTYFHYPETAPRLPLSATGIQYMGSMYGTSPNRSDRIYKKMANYKKNIWWGNSKQWQTGVWLCSWLSGNADDSSDPIWLDRWYYPGYTTLQEALTTTNMHACYDLVPAVSAVSGSNTYIWDAPTQMTFDPGVWYKYIHIGDKGNQFIVDTFLGDDGDALKLHYNDWGANVEDLSIYDNNGIINNWDDSMQGVLNVDYDYTDEALNLNGSNYVITPYSNSYNSNENISVNFWVYSDDWNNSKSSPFVGNYFRGGWGMGYTNNFYNPIIYTIDEQYGHVIPYGIQGKLIDDYLLPKNGATFATPVALVVDSKQYAYILETERNALYKMDYDGVIHSSANFGNENLLHHIELAPSGNKDLVYVCATNGSCSAFETNCLDLETTFNYGTSLSAFTLDLSSNFIGASADITKIIVDNDNIVWNLSGGLFKEEELIIDDVGITDIACDRDNNIWGVRNNGSYFKLDFDNKELIEGDLKIGGENWSISFTYEWIGSINHICDIVTGITPETYNTFAYISDNDSGIIYKVTSNGDLISTITPMIHVNTSKYGNHDKNTMKFFVGNDFASYDYHRKYRYVANNKEPQIYLEYDYYNASMKTPLTQRLYFSAKDFPKTWHHMGFSYDYQNAITTIYIDSKIITSINHDSGTYIYQNYKSPLIIGDYTGKHDNQNFELNNKDYGFKGRISDIRIYNNVINNSDMRHIHLTKYKFNTLIWAMPTGVQNVLEEVERVFKHKLPGMKSQFYNIHITGLQIDDNETRELIENIIKDTSKKIAPVYTELYKIVWD